MQAPLDLQSTFRWGIEHSSGNPASLSAQDQQFLRDAFREAAPPDPAELMKKQFAIAVDSSQSEDDRVQALEQLEDVCRPFHLSLVVQLWR